MRLTEQQRNSIENIVRGAMLPVASRGYSAIDVHAPGAAEAIVYMLAETDEDGAR